MVVKVKDLCKITEKTDSLVDKEILFEDPITGEFSKGPFPAYFPITPTGFKIGKIICNQNGSELSGAVIVEESTDERYVLNKNVFTGQYSWA